MKKKDKQDGRRANPNVQGNQMGADYIENGNMAINSNYDNEMDANINDQTLAKRKK